MGGMKLVSNDIWWRYMFQCNQAFTLKHMSPPDARCSAWESHAPTNFDQPLTRGHISTRVSTLKHVAPSDVIWNIFNASHWNSFLPFFLLDNGKHQKCFTWHLMPLVKERILDSDSKDSNHLGFFRKDSRVRVRKISDSNPGFGFKEFESFSLSSQMWLFWWLHLLKNMLKIC